MEILTGQNAGVSPFFTAHPSLSLSPAMSATAATCPQKPLLGQIAVVTGGHRGVGSAVSIALAEAGADICVVDRNGPGDSQVPGKLKELSVKHWSVCADLSDADEVIRAAEQVVALVSQVDILVIYIYIYNIL